MAEFTFGSSGEAYDACQCDEDIKDGDVLIIKSEKVVGIAGTWPVAVTVENGELHVIAAGVSAEEFADGDEALVAGLVAARAVAKSLGFEVK